MLFSEMDESADVGEIEELEVPAWHDGILTALESDQDEDADDNFGTDGEFSDLDRDANNSMDLKDDVEADSSNSTSTDVDTDRPLTVVNEADDNNHKPVSRKRPRKATSGPINLTLNPPDLSDSKSLPDDLKLVKDFRNRYLQMFVAQKAESFVNDPERKQVCKGRLDFIFLHFPYNIMQSKAQKSVAMFDQMTIEEKAKFVVDMTSWLNEANGMILVVDLSRNMSDLRKRLNEMLNDGDVKELFIHPTQQDYQIIPDQSVLQGCVKNRISILKIGLCMMVVTKSKSQWDARRKMLSEEWVDKKNMASQYLTDNVYELNLDWPYIFGYKHPSSLARLYNKFGKPWRQQELSVDLCCYLLNMFTVTNEAILDPYAGTGTMGIASIITKRKAYLSERDNALVCDALKRIDWLCHSWCTSQYVTEMFDWDQTRWPQDLMALLMTHRQEVGQNEEDPQPVFQHELPSTGPSLEHNLDENYFGEGPPMPGVFPRFLPIRTVPVFSNSKDPCRAIHDYFMKRFQVTTCACAHCFHCSFAYSIIDSFCFS